MSGKHCTVYVFVQLVCRTVSLNMATIPEIKHTSYEHCEISIFKDQPYFVLVAPLPILCLTDITCDNKACSCSYRIAQNSE